MNKVLRKDEPDDVRVVRQVGPVPGLRRPKAHSVISSSGRTETPHSLCPESSQKTNNPFTVNQQLAW